MLSFEDTFLVLRRMVSHELALQSLIPQIVHLIQLGVLLRLLVSTLLALFQQIALPLL